MSEMSFLYHLVPKNMQGHLLLPLNQLKNSHPDIYKEANKKYIGRESLMKVIIPTLDCLWNDVLHFSPVHPELIHAALAELGKDFHAKYFKIPAEIFAPEKTIFYLNGEIPKMDQRNWLPYESALVLKYTEMPELTKIYYKEKLEKNEHPLLYAKIPHILYKGSLDTKNLERIMV